MLCGRNIPLLAVATVPAEDVLRQQLQQVLARPEFQRPADVDVEIPLLSWLLTLLRWLLWPMKWVYELTEGLPEVLRWLIVALLLAMLLALVLHIGWSLWRAMGGGPRLRRNGLLPTDKDQGRATADELEQMAAARADAGALIEAVRLLFRACLLRLEDHEGRRFRRGMTNRQHLRRYGGSPLAVPLAILVQTIELKWYGAADCTPFDFQQCQLACAQIRAQVERGSNADRP